MKTNSTKLNCLWSILCKGSSIDQQSNDISLYDIVEEMTIVPSETNISPKLDELKDVSVDFKLVSLWKAGPDGVVPKGFDIRIELTDPNKKIVMSDGHTINLNENDRKNRLRLVIPVKRLRFATTGDYWLTIKLKLPKEKDFETGYRWPIRAVISTKRRVDKSPVSKIV